MRWMRVAVVLLLTQRFAVLGKRVTSVMSLLPAARMAAALYCVPADALPSEIVGVPVEQFTVQLWMRHCLLASMSDAPPSCWLPLVEVEASITICCEDGSDHDTPEVGRMMCARLPDTSSHSSPAPALLESGARSAPRRVTVMLAAV